MMRYIATIINWGIDHFSDWVVGIFVGSLIAVLANHIGTPSLLELYIKSQHLLIVVSFIIDLQWWLVLSYSIVTFIGKQIRNGFRIHF